MEHLEKLINEKFVTVNTKLDGINSRLDKINGSVGRHEKQITEALAERAANRQKQEDYFTKINDIDTRMNKAELADITHTTNCPQAPRIRVLEDQQLQTRSVKRFMAYLFGAGIALGGLLVGVIELILHIGS